MPHGYERVSALIRRAFGPEEAPRAMAQVAPFASELDAYAEVIFAPGEVSFGLMTRGEDDGFTARVARTLVELGLPAEAVAHHRALASWFEHKRAFFKIEWRRDGANAPMIPRASCYFRRRPKIDDALRKLAELGVSAPVREEVAAIAAVTEKSSVHFVAAAFSRERPVDHKLYFSQYATAEQRGRMATHVETLLERAGMTAGARELWQRQHGRSLPPGAPTFFVSLNFGDDALARSLKLDYPSVPPARAAEWLEDPVREGAAALAAGACTMAGTRDLTYLGVRFQAGDDGVRLKYYLDFP